MMQSGFTLLELLIGVAVLGILGAAMVAMVRGVGAAEARAASALTSERTIVAVNVLLERDLRDGVATDDSVVDPVRLAMVRPVGEAWPCATGDTTVAIALGEWSGVRLPEAGRDRLWLLVDPSGSRWISTPINAVTSGSCPAGDMALVLSVSGGAAPASMVRVDEAVEVARYHSGKSDWLGLEPLDHSSSIQPFAGPVDPDAEVFSSTGDTLRVELHPAGAVAVALRFVLRPR